MIESRDLFDLNPKVRVLAIDFIARAEVELDVKILVTSTLRDEEKQDALYEQGRTTPGKIVTNAKGGDSFHQYRVAFDIVPIRDGKPVWDSEDPIWPALGKIAKIVGLEWAGEWKHFKETAHFQYTQGLTIAEFKNGAELNHAIV